MARRPLSLVALLGAAHGAGCVSPPDAAPGTTAASLEPLAPLEQRLLAARTVRIRARVASGGPVASHFEGTLVLGEGQRARLDMQGDLGSRPTDLSLVCDGTTMRGGSKEHPFELPAPPALRETLVVTFVRMGLLHDLALLAEGRAPAHVDGTVRSWIEAAGVRSAAGEPVRGQPTTEWTWQLVVHGGSTSEEHVWMDASTVLPARRRLVVHFPEGDMPVGEEYEEVTLDAPVDPAVFAVVTGAP